LAAPAPAKLWKPQALIAVPAAIAEPSVTVPVPVVAVATPARL
jgi:hypothetical protein